MDDYQETLRRLAVRDDRFIDSLLGEHRDESALSGLDPRSHALARMGALVAVDATPAAYMCTVEAALKAGASYEEIVGTLIAVLSIVGVPRVVAAAPNLGLALGFDVVEALEVV